MKLNDILPKNARPKPTSETGPVFATSRGWETMDKTGRLEVLVESPYLFDKLKDAGFDQYGKVIKVAKVEEPIKVEEKEPDTDDQLDPISREKLMAMEFSQLKALAAENEVSGNSRVTLVDGLLETFGVKE
ncbi:MAG: DUF7440 family protein [Aeromonas popoffii]|uniref:DUF7440 family protein n=1 Tax=Aeromonas popoffii TaxID=70856 RepID=UPI003F395CB4